MFIVNVEGAIRKENKWLLVKRSVKEEHAGGMLSLVGGKVDLEGSSIDILERTVKREIFEEVGIFVKEKLEYVHNSSFITNKGVPVINIVFLCTHKDGEAFAKSPDEVEKTLWLTTEEVFSHPKAPNYLKESIKRAKALQQRLK